MTEEEAQRVLHVGPGCPPERLRQAYLDLAKVWHPDRFQDDRLRDRAEQSMRQLNEAYGVLQGTRAGADAGAQPAAGAPRPAASTATRPDAWPLRRTVAAVATLGLACGALAAALFILLRAPAVAGPPAEPVDAGVLETAVPPTRAESRGRRGPESGTSLRAAGDTGRGVLALRNGLASDALVMVEQEDVARAYFVRRGEVVTVFDLMPGQYTVRAVTGVDWDGSDFRRSRRCFRLVEPVRVLEPSGSVVTPAVPIVVAASRLSPAADCSLD